MVAAMPEIKAVVGRSVTVICPASGYPLDTISWARGNSARPLVFLPRIAPAAGPYNPAPLSGKTPLGPAGRVRAFPNGSLVLHTVTSGDAGRWVAE